MTTIEAKTTVRRAVRQLERSERGQMTCKLLLDFLSTSTLNGLDGCNSEAVASLVAAYVLGYGEVACEVKESLQQAVDRNQWVTR